MVVLSGARCRSLKVFVLVFRQMWSPSHLGVNMMRDVAWFLVTTSELRILTSYQWIDLLHIEPCAGNGVSLLSLSEAVIHHKVASEVD
jgi:hypothetical protein